MKISDIEVSDIKATKSKLEQNNFIIEFPYVYSVKDHAYVRCNTLVSFWGWDKIELCKYHSSNPNKMIRIQLEIDTFEAFDLVQELKENNNVVSIKGFSTESNDWLEMYIYNSKYEVGFLF